MNHAPALILSAALFFMAGTPHTIEPASTLLDPSPVRVEAPAIEPIEPIDPPTPGPSMTGGTAEQRELVRWAVARFESQGLRLPALHFDLHEDPEACGGNRGLFTPRTVPWLITLCVDHEMTFLHEVGHAWAAFNLSDTQRDAYVALQGKTSWCAPGTPWGERGDEDAAEALAWGLREGQIDSRGMIPGGPLELKAQAFFFLTGFDAPVFADESGAAPIDGPSTLDAVATGAM